MAIVLGIPNECSYCGMIADSKDHVIPISYLHNGKRNGLMLSRGLSVWSCRHCNAILGKNLFDSFVCRAKFLNKRLRSKYKRHLKTTTWQKEDFEDMGSNLKSAVENFRLQQIIAKRRVSFFMSPRFLIMLETIKEQINNAATKPVWANSFFWVTDYNAD